MGGALDGDADERAAGKPAGWGKRPGIDRLGDERRRRVDRWQHDQIEDTLPAGMTATSVVGYDMYHSGAGRLGRRWSGDELRDGVDDRVYMG